MAFHLIVTCVSQKKAKRSHSILDYDIELGSLPSVCVQWKLKLANSSLKKVKAVNLYTGSLWAALMDSWGVVNGRLSDAHLWVVSAGYGLISGDKEIVPYDITFQEPRSNVPSILSKISYSDAIDARRNTIQEWWSCLNGGGAKPNNIESLLSTFSEDDYALFVMGKDYLDAVYQDLKRGLESAQFPEQIAIISNNVGDPLAKTLMPNWLYADSRFVNLPKTNNTLVNARIAHKLLYHLTDKMGGLDWWSIENLNAYLQDLCKPLPEVKKPKRKLSTDEQIVTFIKGELQKENASFTKLHRAYRDSGWACEYSRFKGLYQKTKEELKKITSKDRPEFPVQYQERDTKMRFFLPDWDDRVDPLFDFENDEVTPNRDPYSHDVYHYEIYGSLNCDGILVSKSVLEANPNKKKLARELGIHRYLRLPRNVPVLGDCGAFNYIGEFEPPYNTSEILDYYQNLDFDYGVSLDHLIVPGILKRHRYFVFYEIRKSVEISKDEYDVLRKSPETKEIRSQKYIQQQSLSNGKTLLLKETYIDEEERKRRYQLTIQNAIDFIEEHRSGGYTFCPIGAVQGWSPESYANAAKMYQEAGYNYLALGGLVRSSNSEILEILEAVNEVRNSSTKLHLFGVARIDAIPDFLKMGLSSVDSASMLRQAWLSSANNYYSPQTNNYTAIRIPLADKGAKVKKALENDRVSQSVLLGLEKKCLKLLKLYDSGSVSMEEVLDAVMEYHLIFGGKKSIEEKYRRTLTEQPWKKCPCKLCKDVGIDIAVFRRNNRNRRRGFHNTWVFFREFKKLTTC